MNIKYFILLILVFNCLVSNDESFLQTIIHLAKEYRINSYLEENVELTRQKEILEKAEMLLPKISTTLNLNDAVTQFVKDAIDPLGNLRVLDASDCHMAGTTEDAVFFVYDNLNSEIQENLCLNEEIFFEGNSQSAIFERKSFSVKRKLPEDQGDKLKVQVNKKKLLFVVKAFKNSNLRRGKFLAELSGLHLLDQLALTQSKAVLLIDIASCMHEGTNYILLLMQAAKGKRLDQCVIQGALSKDFTFAKKAYAQAGRAFAELHSTKSKRYAYIPAKNKVKAEKAEAEVLKNPFIVTAIERKMPLNAFQDYLAKTRFAVLQLQIPLTFSHGDAHSENIFYDEEENKVYFIDLVRLHNSINTFDEPIQDGADDLMHMENNLCKLALNILSTEEKNLLINSFWDAYKEFGGMSYAKEHLDFYRNYFNLCRLISYPTENEIFSMALNYFVHQAQLATRQAEQ